MYAVIGTGGKQDRVEVGSVLDVELLRAATGDEVKFVPLLLVDGDEVISASEALQEAVVTAKVLGEAKGPKITGFTYKPKTRSRRRYGHRQRYTSVELTAIEPAGAKPAKS